MMRLFEELSRIQGAMPASWSRMHQMESCPYKWYQRYILGRKEPEVPSEDRATEVGKSVHSVLEGYIRYISRDPRPDTYKTAFESIFNFEIGTLDDTVKGLVENTKGHIEATAKTLTDMRLSGHELYAERQLYMDVHARVLPFACTKPKYPDYGFTGKVDCISIKDGVCSITDFKTEVFSTGREATVIRQLLFYAFMIFGARSDVHTIKLYCAYVLDENYQHMATITRSQLYEVAGKLRGEFESYLRALRAGNWEPTLNTYCQWCGFIQECAAHKQ